MTVMVSQMQKSVKNIGISHHYAMKILPQEKHAMMKVTQTLANQDCR
jgi:hypothetical protein